MHPPKPDRRRASVSSISSRTSSSFPEEVPQENGGNGADVIDVEEDDRFEPPTAEQIALERRRAITRTVLSVVSLCGLVLIVAIILRSGVLTATDYYNSSIPSADYNESALYYEAKVHALCAVTDFRDTCVDALSGDGAVDDGSSTKPTALLRLSLHAASRDVNRARRYAASVDASSLQPRTGLGVADCEELLGDADRELQTSTAGSTNAEFENDKSTVKTPVAGVRDALSAAVAFEETCAEGLTGAAENAAAQLLAILKNATENTRNSLAIASSIAIPPEVAYDVPAAPEPSPHAGDGKTTIPAFRRLLSAGGDFTAPDAVVSKDGTGGFASISNALMAVNRTAKRQRRDGRFVIYVKEGVYDEIVRVTSAMHNVTIYGDGPDKTIVTGNRSYADGCSLFRSATFAVSGFGFLAKGIGFRNTAGPDKGPATGLRVGSDLAAFYSCRVEGHRNALHAHAHRQFYRDCIISGGADAISGDAAVVFQNCEVAVEASAGVAGGEPAAVAAQSRVDRHETTGFVLQNCSLTAGEGGGGGGRRALLGRAAKEHTRVVVVESYLGEVVAAEGWELGAAAEASRVYFGEFGNRGPGAAVERRVKGRAVHLMKQAEEVLRFTTEEFVQGDRWLSATGAFILAGAVASVSFRVRL
ncbi:hypothetical protein Taro_004583 [Colocasia esculenta]|uniref:pectinesterase n=1 Tax=Colocasia esculenta TaxID=4460 RepID=A0A843TMS0_COLES|nr:hypothetical protein [Colocasia esculenta]